MADEPRLSEEPHDRLTRICDAMTDTLSAHPEYQDGDKCIVFLDDSKMGGLVTYGYEDQTAAMATLLTHLQAMFKASGRTLDLMFLDEDGINRV